VPPVLLAYFPVGGAQEEIAHEPDVIAPAAL
jgi:hypothetical protein